MNKLFSGFFLTILSTSISAGTYSADIAQAMRDCKIEQSMTHSNGAPSCLRAEQLIQLQQSEDNQTLNVNINH